MTKEELENLYQDYEVANRAYRDFRDSCFGIIENGHFKQAATVLDEKNINHLIQLESKRDVLFKKWRKNMKELYRFLDKNI